MLKLFATNLLVICFNIYMLSFNSYFELLNLNILFTIPLVNTINKPIDNSKLNPDFITGFTDGDGSFIIRITKKNKLKTGWEIQPTFSIHLASKDKTLLYQIQNFFGVGSISINKRDESVVLSISSLKDLTSVIIPHYIKYPLLTKKRADFELFKKVIDIMVNKKHLTPEGLNKILSLKASINLGFSDVLSQAFPNITPIPRPNVEICYTDISPNWVTGFTESEGCFLIHIQQSSRSKLGKTVKLCFKISQHERDQELLYLIMKYFKCGTLHTNGNSKEIIVTRFQDVLNIVIPFFDKYPLHGEKRLNYEDFVKVAELMQNKAHLTSEGFDKILVIKSGMNIGRDHN